MNTLNLFAAASAPSDWLARFRKLCTELADHSLDDRIGLINAARVELGKLSPFAGEPVDCVTREHYLERFRDWLTGWHKRGYRNGIPDYAPRELEKKYWVPSWRRLCKVLLRNDWWCKGLGLQQPKSAAYARYQAMKRERRVTS